MTIKHSRNLRKTGYKAKEKGLFSHIELVTSMSYDWLMVTKATTAPITAHVGYHGNLRDLASLKLVECQTNESNLLEMF